MSKKQINKRPDPLFSGLDALTDISFHDIPGSRFMAVVTSQSAQSANVFREDKDIAPLSTNAGVSVIPWGANNQMPFRIIDLIERDETMSTCMDFSQEVAFADGLELCVRESDISPATRRSIEAFQDENNISNVWYGQCVDFCNFAFSVVVLELQRGKVVGISRREAAYCRFSPIEPDGSFSVVYANWRKSSLPADEIEVIPAVSSDRPLPVVRQMINKNKDLSKIAVVTRLPARDSTYYPIPSYASLFRSGWYDIKQIIAAAKKANLSNSGAIKYHVQISDRYWQRLFAEEGITDPKVQKERKVRAKEELVSFLSGAENSGKTIFSGMGMSPDGKEIQDVKISTVDVSKQGGDWSVDIQEAVNMICFAMRVHSNLVGSVPGKAQTNNSGSDKRELYTIAQALRRPWHKVLFSPWKLIISLNGWKGVHPNCSLIQLTTLDSHKDVQSVDLNE